MLKVPILYLFLLPIGLLGQNNPIVKESKIKPQTTFILSDTLKETSGLMSYDGLLWTHNDDHDTTLYGVDTLGQLKRKIHLPNVVNHDWEEITQDENYIYIGDFGNNFSGNRRDLSILRIQKNTFYDSVPKIETIRFTYPEQTDFTLQKPNSTNFDCEAMVVIEHKIYLFTKEWSSKNTTVYELPTQAGNYQAQQKGVFTVKYLITGAYFSETDQTLFLCGYTQKGKPNLFRIQNFNPSSFTETIIEKFPLQLRFHQIESVCLLNGSLYLTNEKLTRKPLLNVSPKLLKIEGL